MQASFLPGSSSEVAGGIGTQRSDLGRSRSGKLQSKSPGSSASRRRQQCVCFGMPAFARREDPPQRPQKQQLEYDDKTASMLRYVQTVQGDVVHHFANTAPPYVVEAMRDTITNLLGGLPPTYFAVNISSRGKDFAQLMFHVFLTGHIYRNAQYRMDLMRSTSMMASGDDEEGWGAWPGAAPALPIMTVQADDSAAYANGSQTSGVSGDVLRWHHDKGLERVPAAQYIASLEGQIGVLKQQVATQLYVHASGNELLQYLKGLEHSAVAELASMSDSMHEAANAVIKTRCLGLSDLDDFQQDVDTSALDMGQLMFFLMVVGYNLRTVEVKHDMDQAMLLPARC